MNHCHHCNHDKVNHGSRNGCSVCKRECIEAYNNFWENNPELADMQFDKKGLAKSKELKLWQHWVKNQHFSDSKLFDDQKRQIYLKYQLDNISPCMEFDQWWYGHGITDNWSNKRYSVDLREVKLEDILPIITNELEIIQRELDVGRTEKLKMQKKLKSLVKTPPKQTKKGKKK